MPDKDPKKVALGNRLRQVRERRRMDREQLAKAADVSVRAIVQWELGEREPGWFNVQALAKALGVSCDEFMEGGAGKPAPKESKKAKRTPPATPAVPPAEDLEAAKKAKSKRPK